MKLYPRKDGNGLVTAYSMVLGSAEARKAGFVTPEGKSLVLEKVLDKENHTITIRIAKEQPTTE